MDDALPFARPSEPRTIVINGATYALDPPRKRLLNVDDPFDTIEFDD